MIIVVDENIPFGREAFSTLGDVLLRPGRAISREDVRRADALAVRSVTRVDASLLEGASVRYVLTATIGADHLDEEFLNRAGILYAGAPGCNADSVADYVVAALLHVAGKRGTVLEGKTLGVVGCGNVGSRVVRRARALGMRVLENDPPLERQTGDSRYLPLNEILAADFVTIHTPLTYAGGDATFRLVDDFFLAGMKKSAILLNTARGGVVDSRALKAALRGLTIAGAVLDVWESEPRVDPDLVRLADLATPHIAGHSFDGKVNGTTQIYRKLCEWLGEEPVWDAAPLLPEPDVPTIELDAAERAPEDVLRDAVFAVYPIARDDGAMRQAISLGDADDLAAAFDRLRRQYPRRREFSLTKVLLADSEEPLSAKIHGIGFRIN